VVSAAFERSATRLAECPPQGVPEVAFAGRSNVGKSSLLNALCGRRDLARTSATPGRTQLLNFFALELEHESGERRAVRCVDLPGWGFASAPKAVRESFAPMVETYVRRREALRGFVLLVDARRGVDDRDLELLELASARDVPSLLVATKADKLSAPERGLVRRRVAEAVGAHERDVLLVSSRTGIGVRDGELARDLARLAGAEDGA
jgi:GTP-binding protein